ncbi:MAG TPA: carboxypeptidase-like regulatory domain-containing protein [Gemmatimonadaceae bacterium]|nr:carboxypeptidase-like regulatory domain-containing protein [Gemmatimonadaceae bacterium]
MAVVAHPDVHRRQRREPRLPLAIAAVLMMLAASALRAQIVRGVVRDSTARAPIAGAQVTLLSPRDSALARARSSADGRFSLSGAASGEGLRLRVTRLGYSPRTVALHGEATLDIALLALPSRLDTVRVASEAVCRKGDNSPRAIALWEQARNELRLGIEAPARAGDTARITRAYRGIPRQILTEAFDSADMTELQAFSRARRAVEAFLLDSARRPAALPSPDDPLFGGGFLPRHCLRFVAGHGARAGDSALMFDPVRGHDRALDVTGDLWFVPGGAVHALEFQYINTDISGIRAFHGWVGYTVNRAGAANDADWWLYAEPTSETSHDWRKGIRGPFEDDLPSAWDAWGLAVERLDSPLTLSGSVTLGAHDRPAVGVRVAIRRLGPMDPPPATHDGPLVAIASTDSAGRFRFTNLIEAWYTVAAVDSSGAPLSTQPRVAEIRLGMVSDYLEIESYEGRPYIPGGFGRETFEGPERLTPFPQVRAPRVHLELPAVSSASRP